MRRFYRLLVSLLAGGLALSLGVPARADTCSDQNTYFPLTPGAVWTYRITTIDNGEKEVVQTVRRFAPSASPGKGTQIAGELRESIDIPDGSMTTIMPIRVVNRAVHVGAFQVEATGPSNFTEKGVFKPRGFELYLPDIKDLNGKWLQSGAFSAAATGGTHLQGSFSETNTARARGIERVVVPAGRFMALKIDSIAGLTVEGIGTGKTVFTEWFAPGVGLVKAATADGRYVLELTQYVVPPCCEFVVTKVEGNATINGKPVEAGAHFSSTSSVKVAQGGRLSLAIGPGSTLQVGSGAEFAIQTQCNVEERERNKTTFEIAKGKFWFLINRSIYKLFSRSWDVNTPSCGCGVRGTEFSVEIVKENGRPVTAVEVTDGNVSCRKKGETKEIVLHAGESGRY